MEIFPGRENGVRAVLCGTFKRQQRFYKGGGAGEAGTHEMTKSPEAVGAS